MLVEIFYSFLTSHGLFLIIRYFFLSERNIVDLKKEEDLEKVYDKVDNVKRCLTIWCVLLYVRDYNFNNFLYFLSSFEAVYQNIQFHLLYCPLFSPFYILKIALLISK